MRAPRARRPRLGQAIGKRIVFHQDGRTLRGILLDIYPACVRVEADLGSGWPHRFLIGMEQIDPDRRRPAVPGTLPVTLARGPLHHLDEREFTQLLAGSLSLNAYEKKRVIHQLPCLSQFQVDELIKVWQDEAWEFAHLWSRERDTILGLQVNQRADWEEIVQGLRRQASSIDLFALLDNTVGGGR
jgi:hypothetical protein